VKGIIPFQIVILTRSACWQDGLTELNGGAGDQVSCLLPVLPVDSSINPQILPLDSRAPEGEQPVATVPTANGGTRRKHHRPWTLREVMTLVEGVARCGGGKWADIKKLAFAAVGYRTAVDLKVSVISWHLTIFDKWFQEVMSWEVFLIFSFKAAFLPLVVVFFLPHLFIFR
jgi:hypothetical protein